MRQIYLPSIPETAACITGAGASARAMMYDYASFRLYGEDLGMYDATRDRLLKQGYREADICDCKNIATLARWTPAACCLFGMMGLFLKSPAYMIALGLLTLLGAASPHSFFDYLYVFLVKPFVKMGEMPKHGNPRRFGCSIGAFLYVLTGIGFIVGNAWMIYVPALTIICLSFVAATTQWCFASSLYALFQALTHQRQA
jgi:hypothetical protein